MADIIIRNGTVIAIDPERRIITDGAVAIEGDRIIAVGPTAEVVRDHEAGEIIDARGMAIMPGFVDSHAHAGHGLIKTIGGGRGDLWYQACQGAYTVGSTPEFWHAEAQLAALERLRFGVTAGVSLLGGGALGARIMPVMTGFGFGWRTALAWLSMPALVALAVAWLTLRETRAPRPGKAIVGHLLRRRRTWALMAAFGLVNGGYSSIITWLAPYYQSLGWRSADSASLVAIMAICQAIAALGLPPLARNNPDRRPWLLLTLAMQATGFAGLAFAPDWSPAFWAGICGAGLGSGFALAIVTALDHLPHPEQAGALVALMQGGGFLLASLAPLLLALLHDWTGTYSAGWIMHIGFVAVTVIYAESGSLIDMQHVFTGFEKVPSLSLRLTGEGRIGIAPQDGADLGERTADADRAGSA